MKKFIELYFSSMVDHAPPPKINPAGFDTGFPVRNFNI